MRVRKGSRGLYYQADGKTMCRCEYNRLRLNIIEQYKWVWNSCDFFADVFAMIQEIVDNVIQIVTAVLMLPFLGFYGYFKARKDLNNIKKDASISQFSKKRYEELTQKFPANYYEEIELEFD